ncbi:hypothetical protein BY996DRAFT_6589325 [Phakopsora pachyrhizi]|nr:hypothetical protein BY996DRAFT_6589325 [Phakopsora pachyrhizi]
MSPAQFRFPSYQLKPSKPKTLKIPTSSVNLNNSNITVAAMTSQTGVNLNSNSTPTISFISKSTATQRLASLFGASTNHTNRPENKDLIAFSIQMIDQLIYTNKLNIIIRKSIVNKIRDGLGSLEKAVLLIIIIFVSNLSPQDPQNHLGKVSFKIQRLYQLIDHKLKLEFSSEKKTGKERIKLLEVSLEVYDWLCEEIGFEEDAHLTKKIAELDLMENFRTGLTRLEDIIRLDSCF